MSQLWSGEPSPKPQRANISSAASVATKLDAKSEITVAKPEENRAKEVDSRSLRRRKSVDMPVKVLTLERKHKERKSNDSNQPVSPTSEKADAPSWVAVAQVLLW